MSKCAYVYVIFKGDRYVPGVLASSYSLKKTGTKHEIVILATKDVSKKSIDILSTYSDRIKIIEYIRFPTTMKTKNQLERYKNMDFYFTKWSCLGLEEYEKIIYLDSATLVVKPLDHLFRYKDPVCIFLKAQKKISREQIIERFESKDNKITFPFMGGGILKINPSKKLLNNYLEMMKKNKYYFFKFYKKFLSGPDEITFTYFMSYYSKGPKTGFNVVNFCYSYSFYKYLEWGKKPCKLEDIKVFNVSGNKKVWEEKPGKYQDAIFWHVIFKKIMEKNPQIKLNIPIIKNIPKDYDYKKEIEKLL